MNATSGFSRVITSIAMFYDLEDPVAFARLLDWHAREGSDGVIVGGTTGESATLSAAEAAELLQIAVQRLKMGAPQRIFKPQRSRSSAWMCNNSVSGGTSPIAVTQ